MLDRKFLIVSGKGGVGRTTTSAALARAAVRSGRRVLLAQMQSPERLARLLGHPKPIGDEITTICDGLDAVNMTPRSALHQYGLMVLRYETLYRALFDSKAVRGFIAAIPGLDAYAMLGKAWWHTTERIGDRPRYDLVILDGPASGHATTMLKIPKAILEAMPKGPLIKDALAMRALFADPKSTAFVIVTLAEELPARETVELARTVRADLQIPLGPLIVNGLPSPRLSNPAVTEILRAAKRPTTDAGLDATLDGAALLAHRRHDAEEILKRLKVDPGLPIIELPALSTTDLGPAEIEELAALLQAKLSSS